MPISKCLDLAALRPSIPSVTACILSLTVSAHSQTYQSPKFIGEDFDRVSLRHIVALDDGALIVSGYAVKSNKVESIAVKDRKSTRLNSSHLGISYAVFCLKKK